MAARLTLPYAHLNLRRNPFGELPADERAALAVADVEAFVERLRRPGFAVQFLGESGRGKSTHLLALRRHVPDAPYVRLDDPGSRGIPRVRLLFLDELQHLPALARARLFARPASFAIGSHLDHTAELRRAGLDTHTVHLRGLTAERLARMIERRIEAARRGPGPLPRVGEQAIATLLARHGDDVRAVEDQLYDAFERLRGVGDVEV